MILIVIQLFKPNMECVFPYDHQLNHSRFVVSCAMTFQASLAEDDTKPDQTMSDTASLMEEVHSLIDDRIRLMVDKLLRINREQAMKIDALLQANEELTDSYHDLLEKHDKVVKRSDEQKLQLEEQTLQLDEVSAKMDVLTKENEDLTKRLLDQAMDKQGKLTNMYKQPCCHLGTQEFDQLLNKHKSPISLGIICAAFVLARYVFKW